jgi:hypothetical protein
MDGQVLGHVNANYNSWEDNFYQIDNIELDADLGDIALEFDFDSWIQKDGDGFAVAINDGSGWDLLTPTAASAMEYVNLGQDDDLALLTGHNTANPTMGFSGFAGQNNSTMLDMAGTAIFDIAASLVDRTVSLRFAFASNGSSSGNENQEGINIDNILLTGVCTNSGSGVDCDPPGSSVPAPATLALAAFALLAVARRKRVTAT